MPEHEGIPIPAEPDGITDDGSPSLVEQALTELLAAPISDIRMFMANEGVVFQIVVPWSNVEDIRVPPIGATPAEDQTGESPGNEAAREEFEQEGPRAWEAQGRTD